MQAQAWLRGCPQSWNLRLSFSSLSRTVRGKLRMAPQGTGHRVQTKQGEVGLRRALQQSERANERLRRPLLQAAKRPKACSSESKPQFRVTGDPVKLAPDELDLGRRQRRRLAGVPFFCPQLQLCIRPKSSATRPPFKMVASQGSGLFPPKGEPVSPVSSGSAPVSVEVRRDL